MCRGSRQQRLRPPDRRPSARARPCCPRVRRRLGPSRPRPALTATAATAAPAPAPAPRIQSGGEWARNRAERTMIATTEGTMNPSPPTTAPAGPATRRAQKIASWVEAGPGSRLHPASASSKSRSAIHSRRSTTSRRSSAIWVGGPPNPVTPIRVHSRATSPSGTRTSRLVGDSAPAGSDPPARLDPSAGPDPLGRRDPLTRRDLPPPAARRP